MTFPNAIRLVHKPIYKGEDVIGLGYLVMVKYYFRSIGRIGRATSGLTPSAPSDVMRQHDNKGLPVDVRERRKSPESESA